MKSDNKKSDRDLNKDIHRTAINERFPESNMTKDSREDAEKMKKNASDIEPMSEDLSGTVGSRKTGNDPEDIAGVSDLDNAMERSKRK